MQKPSDETLVAYLDGELDESERAEIEAGSSAIRGCATASRG